jgi:hypothetical protein
MYSSVKSEVQIVSSTKIASGGGTSAPVAASNRYCGSVSVQSVITEHTIIHKENPSMLRFCLLGQSVRTECQDRVLGQSVRTEC